LNIYLTTKNAAITLPKKNKDSNHEDVNNVAALDKNMIPAITKIAAYNTPFVTSCKVDFSFFIFRRLPQFWQYFACISLIFPHSEQ
jgi:hypothetical protein